MKNTTRGLAADSEPASLHAHMSYRTCKTCENAWTKVIDILKNLTYQLIPSVGQYILQRYNHWVSPKPLWPLLLQCL